MSDFVIQILLVLAFMVVYNVTAHNLLRDNHQLGFALAMTALVLLIGYNAIGLTSSDFGFSNPLKGFLIGGFFALFLSLLIVFGSKFKKTKSFFSDTRVLNIKPQKLLRKTLIDIPFATVLFEELLFRGLILGFLLTQTTQLYALIGSSVLFGIWHILPALDFAKTNDKAKGFPLLTIVGTVIFTGLTGMVFGWLRIESGSIIAPMLIHFASNSGSYTASWFSLNSLTIKK